MSLLIFTIQNKLDQTLDCDIFSFAQTYSILKEFDHICYTELGYQ